jgi:hypothetical protein
MRNLAADACLECNTATQEYDDYDDDEIYEDDEDQEPAPSAGEGAMLDPWGLRGSCTNPRASSIVAACGGLALGLQGSRI